MSSIKAFAAALGLAFMAAATGAAAADQAVHLRGEITSVDGDRIVVKARNGASTTVAVPQQAQVLDVSRTSLADIAENSYLGIAAAPAPEGKVRALGVMVFPEGARGLNEGHFPWDKGRRGTMTNATVARLVAKGKGAELDMRFGDKTQKVLLDASTVYGKFVPGTRALVAAKSKVMIIAQPGADGVPVAQFILVGRDGFLPPI